MTSGGNNFNYYLATQKSMKCDHVGMARHS